MPLHLKTLKSSFNETKEELSKQINKYKIILNSYINKIVSEFNSIYDKIKNLQKNQPRKNYKNRENKIEELIKRDLKIFELIEKEEFFKFIPQNSRIEIYDIRNLLEKLLVEIKEKTRNQVKTNNKSEKLQSNIHEGEKEITRKEKSFEFGSTRRIYEIARMLKGAISSKAPEEAESLYKALSDEIKNFLIKCIIQGHRNEVEKLKVDPITLFKTRAYLQLLINRKKINSLNIKGLAIVDLDNLKQINDRYGHLIGDKVIQKVGKIISKVVSQNTKAEIIRYGGDEFLILFFDDKNFIPTLHRIINEIGKAKIIVKKEKIKLTSSIGATKRVKNLGKSIKIADKNLYKAKKQGGNKVIIS
jgi:diguanylate cyclase (GGDEF)-like protein